ncbi:helix-turn-helix domain-containing protein [Parendozoicomonas haliclonae]|uniref:Bacterial regulatory protein, luxR family n=1 Tax=Parendozoicomonas haliclonae TaxID=1960125 RepID=A0A1X7ATU9_9GAMM|nr:helix-turn-helix transcriptional regulator [Parendozoicomonas haliclonae]SMA50847.1 Bacterial regulatory protein, luxR family [Parendozoicomonas haliclonae]
MSMNLSAGWMSQEFTHKRPLDCIKESLMAELEIMGFHSFTYDAIPFRIFDDINAPAADRLFKLSHIATAKTSLASSEDEFKLYKHYLGIMKESNVIPKKQQLFERPNVEFMNSREKARRGRDNNYNSAITWPISAFCSSEWGATFFLKSWRQETDMALWFEHKGAELGKLLFGYHLELMLHYRDQFNPYLQLGAFSKKTLSIIRLAANGYSGRQIGEQLCITERGVDYHIEQLKQKLQARNRLHLIKIAEKLEIT